MYISHILWDFDRYGVINGSRWYRRWYAGQSSFQTWKEVVFVRYIWT